MHTPMGYVQMRGTHCLRWEKEGNSNTYNNHNHIPTFSEDVAMHYSLAVLFHVFHVVRKENTVVISKRITDTIVPLGIVGLTN